MRMRMCERYKRVCVCACEHVWMKERWVNPGSKINTHQVPSDGKICLWRINLSASPATLTDKFKLYKFFAFYENLFPLKCAPSWEANQIEVKKAPGWLPGMILDTKC